MKHYGRLVDSKNPNSVSSFVIPYTESETSCLFFNKVSRSSPIESRLKRNFDLVLSFKQLFHQTGIYVCEEFTVYETPRVHLITFRLP
jgi:hypothetical protein